jgi:hypothetical protein
MKKCGQYENLRDKIIFLAIVLRIFEYKIPHSALNVGEA